MKGNILYTCICHLPFFFHLNCVRAKSMHICVSVSRSVVSDSVTPWTVACQAPPSMGFSRQEYWCGFPFPSPGDLPDPGIVPRSPALQADSLPSEPPGAPVNLTVIVH